MDLVAAGLDLLAGLAARKELAPQVARCYYCYYYYYYRYYYYYYYYCYYHCYYHYYYDYY